MATQCLTKSITLIPGESFILPPNSKVLGATDIDSLTSLCTDLDNLEQLTCYLAILAGYKTSNGNTEYFEQNTQRITGFSLNGQYTAIGPYINNNSNGSFYPQDIANNLVSQIPGIVSTSSGIEFHTSNGDNSQSYIVIKTFPSIGNNLKLHMNSSAPMDSGQEGVNYIIPFITLQSGIDAGYANLPTCA